MLKSIVYDFDGLDVGQTDLPEGDYPVNDLSYQVAANPLNQSDILGDRVLKLNLNWNTNYGAFGRGISRYIEFNPTQDVLNFYFYNPYSNNQSAVLDVVITDDDNQSNMYEYASDDTWKKSFTIPGSSGWQLFSVPLNQFTDINPGGNGIFDIAFTQNKGMLLMVEFRFFKPGSNIPNPVFYLDMINFSEGPQPRGATIFDLPAKSASDYCLLGAYHYNTRGNEYLIPSQIESLFPVVHGKKLRYANYFLGFASDGTTVPKELPGNEVQTLLNNGYRPIITWEPMFHGYDRLDYRQPRLSNIINGDYNAYIDAFADRMKTFSDTVIIRFMHEFEGNWYSWSLEHNNKDPNLYVNAFRTVVNRFRARGATKVKWMWCVNSDYFPYKHYNWVVPAYPGDTYVDIVATDIYNNHYPPNLPWWRSFRWQATETYYYLTKYFPNKQLFICEVGCRERFGSENPASESKGAWFAKMDKELQSDYHKTRALVFFDSAPDQNWYINSSASSLQSLTDNIWLDPYYFKPVSTPTVSEVNCSATGNITREVWTNIAGTSVSDIPTGLSPNTTGQLTSFEAPQYVADNYGQRIRGYVCAPVTGNYVFWIASDDNSELWLSSTESPANKQKIAYVSGWTSFREWTKYPTQQSASIYLTAGKKYYIEALHKEGAQGDHLSVGWQLPNGMLERPVPGNRLSPYTTPQIPSVSITSPANNSFFTEPATIVISANASVSNGTISKVEFFQNGVKLGEDITAPYNYTWTNVSAGSYSLTAKATDSQNLNNISAVVKVTVGTSSSCNISQTILREYWNNFTGTLAQAPFYSAPSGSQQLTVFEAPQYIGDYYASRIRGYVCPPATGNYTFWICSDDQSELWISSDNNPANKVKRAYVPDWTMPKEWTKYPYQQSSPVYLVAGQKYYIEAIHREGSQGDHLAVGWALPNGTLERPIPGVRLSTFTTSSTGNTPPAVSITSPVNNQRFSSPVNITIMANASDANGSIAKVEFYERTTKLGELYSSPYNFGWFNVTTGNYTLTAKAFDNQGVSTISSPVNIEVTSCTTPWITAQGPTTFCNGGSVVLVANSGYEQYQWKVNGVYVSGATSPSYVATVSGEYQIKTVKGSCVAWSAPVYVTVNNCKSESAVRTIPDTTTAPKTSIKAVEPIAMKIFPNPNNGMFAVEVSMAEIREGKVDISVVNSIGQTVLSNSYSVTDGYLAEQIELDKDLPTGVYILKVSIGKNVETTRLLLTK